MNGNFLVDDNLYFCGECESDDEFDSEMNNCQCEECDYDQYEITHMSREASSHPTDETGTFGESKYVSIDYIDELIMIEFNEIFNNCRLVFHEDMFIDALNLEKSYFEIGQFLESDYRAIAGNRFIYIGDYQFEYPAASGQNCMVVGGSSTVAAGASSLKIQPHRLASLCFPPGSAIQNPQTQQGASGVRGGPRSAGRGPPREGVL